MRYVWLGFTIALTLTLNLYYEHVLNVYISSDNEGDSSGEKSRENYRDSLWLGLDKYYGQKVKNPRQNFILKIAKFTTNSPLRLQFTDTFC